MNIKWDGKNEGSLWYIMKFLIEFVLKMDEYGVYHSDIKNANIVVIEDWQSNFIIRIIDLGGVSFDFQLIESWTP